MKWFQKLKNHIKIPEKTEKSKWIALLFLVGCLLMLLPSHEKKQTSTVNQPNMINQEVHTQKELEKLLSKLAGCQVKLFITYEDAGKTEIVREENVNTQTTDSGTQAQIESKPVFDGNKNVIVKNQHQPKIRGVCVFCFGTCQKATEEVLLRAAAHALGTPIHTVEVVVSP